MLPAKIKSLVLQLIEQTESGSIKWNYDDENASVDAFLADRSKFKIKYQFDYNIELATFTLRLESNEKEYIFTTDQSFKDYDYVKRLYESAQASDLDLNL